jgi:hypothetical protein
MHESYAYVILERKTKRLRKETGNTNLRSSLDTGRDPKTFFKIAIIRPLKMLFLSPIVFLLSLYMAMVYGYLSPAPLGPNGPCSELGLGSPSLFVLETR